MNSDTTTDRLLEVEERFRVTLAVSNIGVWEWHPPSGKTFWDERCRALWGIRPDQEPTYEDLLSTVHEDDRAMVQARFARALDPAVDGAYEAVFRVPLPEGPRWLLARGRCSFDDQRRPLRFIGTVLDVTEREQLREKEQAHVHRAEVWGNLAARLVRAKTLTHGLRAVCEEVAAALSVPHAGIYLLEDAKELTSTAYVYDLVSGQIAVPMMRAILEAAFERYGTLAQFPDVTHVEDLPNHAVMMHNGVRSLAWAALSLEDTRLGAIAIVTDGAVRHFDDDQMAFLQAAADLASVAVANFRVAERQQRILSAMTEGVVLTRSSGVILFANPAFEIMLGYAPGELAGKSLRDLIYAEDRDAQRALSNSQEGARVSGRTVARYRSKQGREVWVSIASAPLSEASEVTGYLGIYTDITESRKLDIKLQHAQKLESLGVLAGGIAHDFNNLLVGVLGNAGLALDELPQEAPARDRIADIQTAAIRASELTKQLLAYAGKGRFVIGKIDLRRLVEEMGHLLSAVVPKNAIVKYNFAPNLPLVEGDATQLRQVVMNLITNAADAIGERSGIITVSTSIIEADQAYLADTYVDEGLPSGYYVSLEVSDTGVGMSAETRTRIFDPFFTTKFTGRGLGLAAVIGILRSHRAAIKVYSELGRGSTIRVLIPAIDGVADAIRAPVDADKEWRGSGVVLVVDDDEGVRNVAKRTLERAGFRVLVAGDGIDGIAVFRQHLHEIRVVLLDVTMPRMGGEETFRQLRQIAPEVRVLLSSGYSEQEATSRFAGKGLAGFVEKPFSPQGLVERLRLVLESSSVPKD